MGTNQARVAEGEDAGIEKGHQGIADAHEQDVGAEYFQAGQCLKPVTIECE
ncbi:hypothetical protein D3C78_1974850 [compost metagenome]